MHRFTILFQCYVPGTKRQAKLHLSLTIKGETLAGHFCKTDEHEIETLKYIFYFPMFKNVRKETKKNNMVVLYFRGFESYFWTLDEVEGGGGGE